MVWPWRMRISGDHMAWQIAAGDPIIVVINRLAREFIAFESTEEWVRPIRLLSQPLIFSLHAKATFELFPGHILLASPTSRSSTPCSLHLYSLTSLGHLWCSVRDFNFHNCSSLKGMPSVVLNVAGNNIPDKTSPSTISVEVTGCPVHSETYDLVVVLQNSVRPLSSSRLVSAGRRLRFHDSDTNDRPVIWKNTISGYHFELSSGRLLAIHSTTNPGIYLAPLNKLSIHA
jgi:hypothetical protein